MYYQHFYQEITVEVEKYGLLFSNKYDDNINTLSAILVWPLGLLCCQGPAQRCVVGPSEASGPRGLGGPSETSGALRGLGGPGASAGPQRPRRALRGLGPPGPQRPLRPRGPRRASGWR